MSAAGAGGAAPESARAVEDERRRLRGLIRAHSGLLMNVMEKAAGSEDKVLLRNIVDAAFYIFSGAEGELPGGREFWGRMRMSAPGQSLGTLPAENARARELHSFEVFQRELEDYASTRPEVRRILEESKEPSRKVAEAGLPKTTGASIEDLDSDLTSLRRRPPPRQEGAPILTAVPVPSKEAPGTDINAVLSSVEDSLLKAPVAANPASAAPEPPIPATGRARTDTGSEELRARLERAEAELGKKDALLKDYEDDMKRIYDQLKGREALPGLKELEQKLVLQEEEARMAREDLANMERKYRENLELLKAEARDRGELQKRLTAAEGEVSRAQVRLREEEQKLAETRSRLDKKEAELEKLGDRLHGLELELVKKEEDIKIAMEHLRDEEAERRRVLEALREEAREKAQMEHRLKKREMELSRLEVRIHDEEKRVESLKGSQAVSEEESLKRTEELRLREEEVRAMEVQTREKVLALRKDEDEIKERISRLKQDLRESETLEVQMRRREELRAALEARYRAKEDELVKELRELEAARARIAEREKELFGLEKGAGDDGPRATARGTGSPVAAAPPGAKSASARRAFEVTHAEVEAERVADTGGHSAPPGDGVDRRNEILEMLSRRIRKK